MDLQLKYAAALTKGVNAATRTIDAIVSDETIDRMGDVIDVASWKLDRYRSNPVVLFQHQRDQPIGRADRVWIESKQLHARMVLSDTERGREILQWFAEGTLRAFSVGFRAGLLKDDVVAGQQVTRLLNCELFEISAVSVPANPSALVKHKSLGLVPSTASVVDSDPILTSARKAADGDGIEDGEDFLDFARRRADQAGREFGDARARTKEQGGV